ncbi:FHA domain-containing protein [Sorangium sp. So ce1389]|uniref:FHA domain-containing protein n=1 Tax=Sorangium sp. So ce1389 TaxID=3133336 RepID=UPI003F62997C
MQLVQIFPESDTPLRFDLPAAVGEHAIMGDDASVKMRIPHNIGRIVARRQCAFSMADQLIVVDLHSSLPTYVNGEAITACPLRVGDRIRIGEVYEFLVVE